MYLSIVIPCYNESKRIISTLMKISDFLTATNRFNQAELVVVDDGSTDDTVKKVQRYIKSNLRLNIKLIQNKQNKGKGYSVKNGVFHSRGKYILFSDADLSTPIEELDKLLFYIKKRDYDIVIGSRGLPESKILIHQPWYREKMGKIFNMFVGLLVIPGIYDTQCGFKLFKKDVGRRLFRLQKITGFSFDVEVLYLARRFKYRVKEIPVTWINSSASRVSIFSEPCKMLLSLFQIRFLYRKDRNKTRDNVIRLTKCIFMPEDHMDRLYNSSNPLVRFVHNNRLDAILGMIPKGNRLKILDAGCGEGHLISKLGNSNNENIFYGVDVTKIAIEKAKLRCPYAKFIECDISNLNFKNNFFDVIICTEVLEHIYRYKKVVLELKRVLKNSGILIITFPNEFLWMLSRFFLGRKPIKVPDHVRSFTPKKIIKEVNLKVIRKKNLPFNLPFFVSLIGLIQFKK